MAQVIKHQLGGNIQYQSFTPSIQTVLDVRYNTQSIVDYLKDTEKRKTYTNDYRGFDSAQTAEFNRSLDNYIRGIEDGKIVFSNNGLTKLTNIDGVNPAMEPYIKEYFTHSLQSGLVPMYDEYYKDEYKVDLDKILSRAVLGEETPKNIFDPAWKALDPKDEKTQLRGIQNRRSAYAKALRAEADKLENDAEYRKKFKFSGWENDLNAYKKVVQALRLHADQVEQVQDFEKEEGWIQRAAVLGLSSKDVINRFSKGEIQSDDTDPQAQHDNGFDVKGPLFLQTDDLTYYNNNKEYTLGDDYENLPDEVKAEALRLLQLYNRQRIKGDWFYWDKYVNKYLENLSPYFSNNEVSVYSVTNGPLGNSGKKFFIRRKTDKNPIEVEILKNADGTYTAHNSSLNLNLGQYTESEETAAARTYDWAFDLGEPLQFNLSDVLKDAQSTNNYFNWLIQQDTKYVNPKMFSKILMYLSAWLASKPDGGKQYTNWAGGSGRNWYGSTFDLRGSSYNKPISFTWKFRNYGIKFDFTEPNNYITVNGVKTLDFRKIKSVTIDYASKLKTGGKFKKLEGGGIAELVEKQKQFGLNKPVEFRPITPKTPKNITPEEAKYSNIEPQGDPTTADRIRFVAATTDLLSSFLIFPKGTNIASLAGTGLSFLGYLTADMIDVYNGKLPMANTLWNDAKLAAIMAMPVFINPTKAKALGAGEGMQKLAGVASRYIGTAFALGQIASEEARDDILKSWGKLANPTKMNAHDLTNIAFTLRLVAGGREHVKNFKNNRQLKKAQSDNQTGQIDYKVKVGEKETTSSIKVNKGDALDKESVLQKIIEQNKALELKPEQITILNKVEKTSLLERSKDYINRTLGKDKNKSKETTEKAEETSKSKAEDTAENATEPKAEPKTEETSKSNEIIHVDWKDNKTSNPNIEYEEWIPNRAFQYAAKENGNIVRYNTKFGNWLRGILGPEWDLAYSDYRLVKGYRLGKINQLNKGLFTTLDLFRKQGKELEEIRTGVLEGEAKNSALLAKMSEYGYNTIDKEAALAKANELADLYNSDLSKYDNLQIAQMMYDKDREMGIFGKKRPSKTKEPEKSEKPAEEKPAEKPKETPKEEVKSETPTTQSKFNPNDLEYTNQEEITPELLQEAYQKFLEEKQAKASEENPASAFNTIFNTKFNDRSQKQDLVDKVFSIFNIENTKLAQQSQKEILQKLLNNSEVKSRITNKQKFKYTEILNLYKKLLENKQITDAEYKVLIQKTKKGNLEFTEWGQSVADRLIKDSTPQKKVSSSKNKVKKVEKTGNTSDEEFVQSISDRILKTDKYKKFKKTRKDLPIYQIDSIIKNIASKEELQRLDKDLYYKIRDKLRQDFYESYNKDGGILHFTRQVLSASKGSKIRSFRPGGGIQSSGSWYSDYYLPGKDDYWADWERILANENGEYDDLFNSENPDSLYKMNVLYANLLYGYQQLNDDTDYFTDDEGSVKRYQEWINKYFPSLISNTARAYTNGRYRKGDTVLTGTYTYNPDDKFAAITRDWNPFINGDFFANDDEKGYYNSIKSLQEKYKDRYTFYSDSRDGSIIPIKNGSTLTDYGVDESELEYWSPITQDTSSPDSESNGQVDADGQNGSGDSENTQKTDELGEINPLPAEWFANLPKDNLTTARLLNTLFGNAMTYAVRDKYKPLFAKDQTYLDFKRVFRDTSAINETNKIYGQFLSRQQGTSSDQRYNTAAVQDLMSKYNTALLAAEDQNKKTFDTTSREAAEAAKTNSLNLTNTYNANLKKYTDERRLQQEYSAGSLKQAGQNISDLFSALIQEKGTDRLYARQHYINSAAQQIQDLTNKELKDTQRHFYDVYISRGGSHSETPDTFYTSKQFQTEMRDAYEKFNDRISKIQEVQRTNLERLYGSIYSSDLFQTRKRRDINPDIYGGATRPEGVSVFKRKQGGKVNMAKQGGASVNWVRVENARMLNKQVNTSMRETYKSLRQANAELQKTIRAMEPLIRKLNRRDSVKLQ